MRSRPLAYRFLLALAPCLLLPLAARAGDCGACCGPSHCCPKTVVCVPRIPNLKFKRVCPKPLCNPCELDGYGYYNTCWHEWPYPPNYSHCFVPPTAAMVADAPVAAPPLPVTTPNVNQLGMPGSPVLPSMPGSGPEVLSQPKY